MKRNRIDITGNIGPLAGDTKWPMYSYDRPAYMLWNAIADELYNRGRSLPKIKKWLQSKSTRWALDGDLGCEIEKLGRAYAQKVSEEP
jgi:hypothetical protein